MSNSKRENLINARLAKGMSRPVLARKVGVSFEQIKSLEYGRVNPSTKLMVKLCHELNDSPESLFKDLFAMSKDVIYP